MHNYSADPNRSIKCPKCDDFGVIVSGASGLTSAMVCQCKTVSGWTTQSTYDRMASLISDSGIPPLFASASFKGKSFDEVLPNRLRVWLEYICEHKKTSAQNLIFLCGGIGNGKTHLASELLKRFILRTGLPGKFLSAEEIVDARRDSDRFAERKNRLEKEHLSYVQQIIRHTDLLVIDEVGRTQIPFNQKSTFEVFIDQRYQSGLPTIVISNHTFKRETSLDGVTIYVVVGKRTGDRLNEFALVELSGPSKRAVRNPADNMRIELSEEEQSSYMFPPSVLMQKDGELQVLNWIARNPVFEAVKDESREIERDKLGNAVEVNGIPQDTSRKQAKVVKDVWQKGDQLIVNGPVLSYDDAKTYITCLDLLKQQHQSNKSGLTLHVSVVKLLESLSKQDSGANRNSTHRSLMRLAGASIIYNDNIGRVWTGPLITFYFQPTGYGDEYEIHFNESMIQFYRDFEYTKFNRKLFEAKIGTDGLRMQLFLRSHKKKTFDMLTFEGWMRFLEKPIDEMDSSEAGKKLKRQCRKKFTELIQKQVSAGLLTPDSTVTRGKARITLTVTPF
jgi:DNA replication protein DnaC